MSYIISNREWLSDESSDIGGSFIRMMQAEMGENENNLKLKMEICSKMFGILYGFVYCVGVGVCIISCYCAFWQCLSTSIDLSESNLRVSM